MKLSQPFFLQEWQTYSPCLLWLVSAKKFSWYWGSYKHWWKTSAHIGEDTVWKRGKEGIARKIPKYVIWKALQKNRTFDFSLERLVLKLPKSLSPLTDTVRMKHYLLEGEREGIAYPVWILAIPWDYIGSIQRCWRNWALHRGAHLQDKRQKTSRNMRNSGIWGEITMRNSNISKRLLTMRVVKYWKRLLRGAVEL